MFCLWKFFSIDLLTQFDRQNDKPIESWVTQLVWIKEKKVEVLGSNSNKKSNINLTSLPLTFANKKKL